MKRAGLLYCADLDAPRFTLLRQREQLPFYASDNANVSKWADYTLQQAYELRLLIDAVRANGGDGQAVSPVTALAAIGARNTVEDAAAASVDVWVGMVAFDGIDQADAVEHSSAPFYGPLSELDGWIAQEAAKWADAYAVFDASRIILVNASRAARFVTKRAQEGGFIEAV